MPYVPDSSDQREFTLRALVLGLLMCVVLGAANAYLGLRAGMTIAATYPAAVIGMAVLRLFKGSTILEENFARTVGSIGESVAAGAIFTIPAFVILNLWKFDTAHLWQEYLVSSALMILGGLLGIMFVTILRRVMVEDPSLQFPESVAASEIHKAGQKGSEAALQLFRAMGVGALIRIVSSAGFGLFRDQNEFSLAVGRLRESFVRLGLKDDSAKVTAGGVTTFSAPDVTPAYLGVGYIIGPELGALNFAGGLLAWGLFVPLLVFFLGPSLIDQFMASNGGNEEAAWAAMVVALWKYIVRPIAVGGMLVGATYTLYKMRKNLIGGIKRGVADVKKSATAAATTKRTERDLSLKVVGLGILAIFVLMVALYSYFTGAIGAAITAAIVMLVTGFFFAAVSGNLVGLIGSSNNPLSGLTLATTIIAALTMVIIGATGAAGRGGRAGRRGGGLRVRRRRRRDAAGPQGRAHPRRHAVEDAGRRHLRRRRGGPRDVLPALHDAQLRPGAVRRGGRVRRQDLQRPAGRPDGGALAGHRRRRDGLAARVRRHRDGHLAHPDQGQAARCCSRSGCTCRSARRSPSSAAASSAAIVDRIRDKRGYNAAQKARVENAGVLAASGLIAGEALVGLLIAGVVYARTSHAFWTWRDLFQSPVLESIVPWLSLVAAGVLVWYLIAVPLSKAGQPTSPRRRRRSCSRDWG